MATHSSALAWRIPGTGEPGGLPSLGSHRVGHDWSNLAAKATAQTILIFSDKVTDQIKFMMSLHLKFWSWSILSHVSESKIYLSSNNYGDVSLTGKQHQQCGWFYINWGTRTIIHRLQSRRNENCPQWRCMILSTWVLHMNCLSCIQLPASTLQSMRKIDKTSIHLHTDVPS